MNPVTQTRWRCLPMPFPLNYFASARCALENMLPERQTGVWMYDGFARIFITFAGLLDI